MGGYQFKVTLHGVTPIVWRRIVIPQTYHFADFAEAILLSMGYFNICLYRFILNKSILIPDYEEDEDLDDAFDHFVKDYLDCEWGFEYNMDFDDLDQVWDHTLEYEGEVPDFEGELAVCIDGENACPPEDVGYIEGYKQFLEIMKDKDHPEFDYMLYKHVQIGDRNAEGFDPTHFDKSKVKIEKALRSTDPRPFFSNSHPMW
jgi:hypothetical protein